MQTATSYSRMQIGLHWAIVVLLAGQYLFHEQIADAWQARMTGTLPNEPFPNLHTVVGIVILALAIWRIVLRLRRGAPALPTEEPAAAKLLAKATHLGFYVLLIGMPISGAVAWVFGLELPAEAHEVAAKVMMALIVLHVAGALVQQFVLKTGVMARMSPKRILGKEPIKDALL